MTIEHKQTNILGRTRVTLFRLYYYRSHRGGLASFSRYLENLPYDPDQLSAPATSAGYCTAYLDITLPSPTRPSLRIGMPRSKHAPYSPLPRRTLAEDIGLRGLGSLVMWHSIYGVRQFCVVTMSW